MATLTDAQLTEMEQAAVELARAAGRILLGYFSGPLQVDFKSENNRNPVTDADHAADAYLRDELARRFPEHGVLTEEATDAPDTASEVMWVIDPLDGTSNFLNGLPVFGVLIAALERGVPVVAAIFLPSIADPEGVVL
ncbi:MAG: inositol monophosphatase family protein, partial [Chloroflexota bacterium]